MQKRPLRIFLCHASADKAAVRQLARRLRSGGFDPWLDEEMLLPGEDWEFEIRKAIRASDVVIVCLSRESTMKSGFVQKEIRHALDVADEKPEGTVFMIPAKLEDCTVSRPAASVAVGRRLSGTGLRRSGSRVVGPGSIKAFDRDLWRNHGRITKPSSRHPNRCLETQSRNGGLHAS